ncbi:acyloxyacyl hydrolase [Mariniflexile sp. AS56]|uniref:acyloxyacyl hydrolase n=1 Tax=Mariniflexile sp. AS56 TaxID=3063957 RepID=UPI0026EAF512|nr:acyloxyacyl hydrolase [Mariniflexile sp. AS56]MDO7171202.1 acyloxyacyl hydrolase [Mariniflexile sp. AS56]
MSSLIGYSQTETDRFKVGFSYGNGSQSKFPFNLKDYTHTVTFYKAQLNYLIGNKKQWAYEINIEPSYNIAEHQLLNEYFIKPEDGDDYQEKRNLYTQKRTINEYVLNLGFLVRYTVCTPVSIYAVGSVGPMISDKATERLAKGYAFSDIFGVGTSYAIGDVQLDFRYSLRHTSNLEFKTPNNGHNTTNMSFSVLYCL